MAYTTQEEFESFYNTLRETFSTGRTKSVQWRKWQLKQCWWMINDNEDEFIKALAQDLHRHPFEAVAMDIGGVKQEIIDNLNHVDEWSKGEAPTGAGFVMGRLGKAWLRKEPLGVALVIGTWNFPIYTLIGPVIAAITAGNCVLLKPSEQAPAIQALLEKYVRQYLDQSAVRIATGGAQETSFMLEHKFDHIFYTGGAKVARIIATAAAKNLTPCVFELGGQSPAIVSKTANIDLAAKRIVHAKLTNAGQVCLNVNHVFADPSIHDQLVERMSHWLKHFLQEGTDHMAHIITDNHFKRVSNLLSSTSGTVVYGGSHNPSTKFIHPTIITDVKVEDSLMSEELFASLIPVLKADVSTAIDTIKSMPHPLGLYIFSSQQSEIDYILNHTTSGGVTVNDVMIHAAVPTAPFGGVGESGYGSYHGKYGFDAFSHTRTIVTMPGWLESVLSFRYIPFKVGNRKYIDTAKANFKRGESMEDQTVGSYGSATSVLTKAVGVMACLAIIDSATGGRLLFVHTFKDVFGRFRS